MKSNQKQHRDATDRKLAERTDWFNWLLHLLLGLMLGAGLACYLGFKMIQAGFLGYGELGGVILGGALLLGGIASHRGNKLWFRPSVSDPYEPPQGRNPRACSFVIGGLGMILILVSLFEGFAALLARPSRGVLPGPVWLVMLLPAAVCVCLVVYALRNGSWPSRLGPIDRDESPVMFWFFISLLVIVTLGLVLVLVRG